MMWSGLNLTLFGITDSLLFDSKQNIIVNDEIYSEKNSKNIQKFLAESTRNKNKIAVTSDLDDKYKPIIEELGFKHQWCLFHVFKNIKKLKPISRLISYLTRRSRRYNVKN
ncbi:MAG: hypothetical protein ABFC12_05785 [Methanobacterium sp.]